MVKFKSYFERYYPQLERIIALIALLNLGLVFFDLTYFHLRPFYRQYLPVITQVYDPVKGVSAHPQAIAYQTQVETLIEQLSQNGLESPQVEASLEQLRGLSQQLLTERIFAAPYGNHALVTIQQAIQARTAQSSTQVALDQFWNRVYLEQQGWPSELEFWNREIRPFFEVNYYRRVNRLGIPIDYFWLIDLPFILIFAVDILLRIMDSRRRHPGLTWGNIVLRRWYDLFLLLPFLRWLRVLPVALRLYQVDLLNLEPIQAEAQRDVVVTVGADIAGIVGIEIIEQLQDSIRQGDLLNWISSIDPATESADTVEIVAQQEMTEIADHLYRIGVENILPRIQPDIEDLVQHSIQKTLQRAPGYPQINHLPGLEKISNQVTQQLSLTVAQGLYHSLVGSLLDDEGKAITTRLQSHLREAIAEELSQRHTIRGIEIRLVNALEKFKLKYVKALVETGGEKLADQTELLRKQIS
jgi:hypothetical protein